MATAKPVTITLIVKYLTSGRMVGGGKLESVQLDNQEPRPPKNGMALFDIYKWLERNSYIPVQGEFVFLDKGGGLSRRKRQVYLLDSKFW